MRRVLVVANLMHASPRIPGIASYLPEFGWQAVILTPRGANRQELLGFPECFNDRVEVAETEFKGDVYRRWRRLAGSFGLDPNHSVTEQLKQLGGVRAVGSLVDVAQRSYQTIFAYPDTERLWKTHALRTSRRLLSEGRWDAIVSSSPHPTSHVIASALQAEFGLPWVADFRDPWTHNHNYPFGRTRKFLETRHELATLGRAAGVTAVTAEAARRQRSLYGREVDVICNGFDPGAVNSPPAPLTEKFTITYTGTIYPGKQDPEKVLAALAALTGAGKISPSEVSMRFFGPRYGWLAELIKKHGLAEVAVQYGGLPHREAVTRQRESHLVLVLDWEARDGADLPSSTKFFEYLAARRPILLTGGGPDTELKRLLASTGAGVAAATTDSIREALARFYLSRLVQPPLEPGDGDIQRFSYRHLAGRFAEILNARI